MRRPQDVIDTWKEDPTLGTRTIAKQTGYSRRSVRRILSKIKQAHELQEQVAELDQEFPATDVIEKAELLAEINMLNRTVQKQQDKLRIIRQERRVGYRYDNAMEAYITELVDLLKTRVVKPTVLDSGDILTKAYKFEDNVGIYQLSDLHLNELINLPHNKYDFREASRRLEKLTDSAIRFFTQNDVSTVHVVMTGDLINSDRRLDELMNMATNRTRATLLATDLLSYVISHLRSQFNVKVHYVTGNESRVDKELTYSEMAVSDNYDTMIYEMLKRVYSGTDGVEFIDPTMPDETVIDVNSKKVLLTHGGSLPKESLGNAIQKVRGKYASFGTIIDYVLFGHFHDCSISDLYARSSSLCGSNSFSDSKLNLAGRASQLLHLVKPDCINTIKIDVQDTDGFEGYNIEENLEAYNAKSITKVVRKKTI